MRIISRRTLLQFSEEHPDASHALRAWFADVRHAVWNSPADISATYRTASIIGGDRVVFRIKGNAYRIIVAVNYAHKIVFIRFVGTHADYDRIDARTI